MKAQMYNPSIPLRQLELPQGEWVLVDERERVAVSGPTLQLVVEVAREMKLDLNDLAFDRFPMDGENELLAITET